MKKTICFLFLSTLIGCATKIPLSREEKQLLLERKVAASQMDFIGVDREKLLKAVENTLYLIDPKDVKIFRTQDRIVMLRSYATILIFANAIGEDTWIVTINDKDREKITLSIALTLKQNFGGMIMDYKVSSPNLSPRLEESLLSEAEAKLIFERINYFLGNSKWISCAEAPDFAKVNNYKKGEMGDFPFVCGDNWHGVNPESPDYLLKNENISVIR